MGAILTVKKIPKMISQRHPPSSFSTTRYFNLTQPSLITLLPFHVEVGSAYTKCSPNLPALTFSTKLTAINPSMKFSVATILAFSTSASAFMGPASQTRQSVSVNVLSEPPLVVEAVVEPVVEPVVVEPKIEPVVAAVETPAVKEVAPAPARVDPKQQIQP